MLSSLYDLSKTICAVSAPTGGGISIIRISGRNALKKTRKICGFLPVHPQPNRAYFGHCQSVNKAEMIDQVIVTYFEENRSFTGEETLEISFHGSPVVARELIEELMLCGCQVAQRGEFTYRAFMNGKIHLAQAEGILDLVQSQSKLAKKMALNQLCGRTSENFKRIEEKILFLVSQVEANIDFSEENLEVISEEEMTKDLKNLLRTVEKLLEKRKNSHQIRNGLQVTLVGRPNVGKSSLFNALCKEDKAIVSEMSGTTRDIVEKTMEGFALPVKLMDTAGLGEGKDPVEKVGMEKARKAQKTSEITFFVFDLEKGFSSEDEDLLKSIERANLYLVGNKTDKISLKDVDFQKQNLFKKNLIEKNRYIFVSAKDRSNLKDMTSIIEKKIEPLLEGDIPEMSQPRHFELFLKCYKHLKTACKVLQGKKGMDLIAWELRESLIAIQEVLGKKFDDDVLDEIFRQFCIGK